MGKRRGKVEGRKEAQPKRASLPTLRVKRGASLESVYAAARRAFSAGDLQKYTEIEKGVPAQRVLAELEAIDRQDGKSKKRRSKHDDVR